MNEVIKTLRAHRSIRSYKDTPVPEEHLERIIRAAQAAPNWVNLQLVSIIAIKDMERRKRFAELCDNQKQVAEAPVFNALEPFLLRNVWLVFTCISKHTKSARILRRHRRRSKPKTTFFGVAILAKTRFENGLSCGKIRR